eukprot:CAMPEP_0201521684 /NCGR_PEP_ID=MMETSP0161_2-20130828/15624_1 /ASSEMBLY_ACC=CAM_ASM_000251 /TAXON_ID=180227 /ORGANISM="Neoparamoeba aestuarina, Strain SoJaBio B1-5/56/2" /LENGTH=169 /DNA_ID=CAMNT_0047920365 /DNA_START=71 /DNA_END=580 /DNA_ORIENTATION=+
MQKWVFVAIVALLVGGLNASDDDDDWMVTESIPNLDNVTVHYNSSSNIGVEQRLAIYDGTIYIDKTYVWLAVDLLNVPACVDDSGLLALMAADPNLTPYSDQINSIYNSTGEIPKDVYSICTGISQFNGSEPYTVIGCPWVSAILMCFDDGCLSKDHVSYGCMDLDAGN